MFHALVTSPPAGLEFDVVMEDIESLNRRALAGGASALAVTKLSVSTFGRVRDRYRALEAGAALGRGCGPLVVARAGNPIRTLADLAGRTIAVPGLGTTAYALLRMFAGDFDALPMPFERIMPAVASGAVDVGLIIHESRFTYRDHGLVQVVDLGAVWEAETGLPLPLGVIAAEHALPRSIARAVEQGLSDSVKAAWANPSASAEYVRRFAQEMDPVVQQRHIALYVNEYSERLGDEGHRALETFLDRGRSAGLF